MTRSIPASFFVKIIPGVIAAAGTALALNGLALTTSWRVPVGAAQSFPSADAVAAYFGGSSPEAAMAKPYFLGFDLSNLKPSALLIAQYNAAAVPAWLRGGSLAAMKLTALKAIAPGALSISINGTTETSASIDLSGATSFSNAATLIQAGFTTPGFTVSFDSVSSAFVFTNTATGATSTIDFATGALATALSLTSATGALTSQGADAAAPGTFMAAVAQATANWATFFTIFDPDGGAGNAVKEAFAQWANSTSYRYAYVCWDPDLSPQASSDASGSLGAILAASNISGTCLVSGQSWDKAAFIAGTAASIDFNEENGRTTFGYRSQTGLTPDINDVGVAANLLANGYNFYSAVAANTQGFEYLWPGSISGPFKWMDSFVNQIWLNAQLQLNVMKLLTTVKSVPYNAEGYMLVYNALLSTIQQALKFGAIRKGVTLSSAQAAEVNEIAGAKIDTVLSTEGWYLQISDPGADVRAARGTPGCLFFYMDGQSINAIDLTSLNVQ